MEVLILSLLATSSIVRGSPFETPKIEERGRRQTFEKKATANCNFGSDEKVYGCEWTNLGVSSSLSWTFSKGENTYWIGGPNLDDSDKSPKGGYAMLEASVIPDNEITGVVESALLESPLLKPTGSKGHCLSFSYAIDGLSADRLRLVLHPLNKLDLSINAFANDIILTSLKDDTKGKWKTGQVLYSSDSEHTLIFEGLPKDRTSPERSYRGYIAVDNIAFLPSIQCTGHCSFNYGLCGYTNDPKSNFQWKVGRGSESPNTGPKRDHSSFSNKKVTGAFAYIDADHPRKAGDSAMLVSEELPATGNEKEPMCLKFWTHMFGNGIGSLNVYIRSSIGDKKVWGLTGDAGNNWHMGQVPLASDANFRVVFEGVVGKNSLGNLAIDDISVVPGVCPTAPQVAATFSGDCSFEDDDCGWVNLSGPTEDELNWKRTQATDGERFPSTDHSLGTGLGFYLALSRESVQTAGDRALFRSLEIKGSMQPKCVSFWYYMYEPVVSATGPSLGKLAVWSETIDRSEQVIKTQLWRHYNGYSPAWSYAQAQVTSETDYSLLFEGVWGNNRASGFIAIDDITVSERRCSLVPETAMVISAECSFDRNSCGWTNSSDAKAFAWNLATFSKRPANLPDKTYGALVGYAYFDIFSTGDESKTVTMTSPVISYSSSKGKLCLSFWFASFGAGDTSTLKIYTQEAQNKESGQPRDSPALWKLKASDLNTVKPEWTAGQLTVEAAISFRLVFKGEASNGGFAVDQVAFSEGECGVRPKVAQPIGRIN